MPFFLLYFFRSASLSFTSASCFGLSNAMFMLASIHRVGTFYLYHIGKENILYSSTKVKRLSVDPRTLGLRPQGLLEGGNNSFKGGS